MHIKPMVATLEAPPSTAIAPPADPRSFTFQMPLFRPGTHVTQNGKAEKVSHVILRRRELMRSEEHTSELQSPCNLVCRLLLEKKNIRKDFIKAQPLKGMRISACLHVTT